MKKKSFSASLPIRIFTIVFTFIALFIAGFMPLWMGPGLNNPMPIGKFLNGNLPNQGQGSNPPTLLSQTGAFSNLNNLTPADGVIPYEMIEPFWSDGAAKFRWLAIPNDGSHNSPEEKIQFSANGPWVFPKGAVLIKHFELGGKRLETRFEVLGNDNKFYYLSYKWNNAQTDAELLTSAVDETVMVDGNPQVWHYPGPADCQSCHIESVGSVLGPKTRNLNKAITYPRTGINANQLVTLSQLGILDTDITDANVGNYMAVAAKDDLNASLEYRARSYIDVNCSSCHQPSVDNIAQFDARITTPLDQQNIVDGPVVYDEGLIDPRVIIPQDVDGSMMHFRMQSLATGVAMPPLAKNRVDTEGLQLIEDWINSLVPEISSPPQASISAEPVFGQAPLVVSFDASASTDADGDNLTYTWDFGDGSNGSGETLDHTYQNPGSYTAYLTANDGQFTHKDSVVITVNNANPGTNTVAFTNASGLLPTTVYSGNAIAVADMNGDGKDDIICLNQAENLNVLYQNNPGQDFSRYNHGAVSNQNQWSICIGDYDHNGFNDILTGGAYDDIKFIKNNDGNNSYNRSILPNSNIFIQGSNFIDIDNDGWADIFACHDDAESRPYKNNGDGTFTYRSGMIRTFTSPSSDNSGNYASMWTDYDNDGDLDLYISKCRGGVNSSSDPRRINMLWQNDGTNRFTEVADQANLKIGAQTWLSDFGDIDNDGDLDCIVVNHYNNHCYLMRNNGDGTFSDITSGSNLLGPLSSDNFFGIQGFFRDFNNDGFLDLMFSGDEHYMFYNNGNSSFTLAPNPFSSNKIHSFAVGDLNHDGFLDIYAGYAVNFNSPTSTRDRLWLNQGNSNNFFAVQLTGTTSNINAIGARLELYGPWGKQIREVRSGEGYGVSNSFTQHFGLGQATYIDSLIIRWPSGLKEEFCKPAINQFLKLKEGTQLSFTYNIQEEFVFPSNVDFDASSSNLNLGQHSLIWDFGDGQSGTGSQPNHQYENSGTYTVILTATHNNSGIVDQVKKEIFLNPGCADQVGQPCSTECVPEGIIQEDCSCQGTLIDNDQDGICDVYDQDDDNDGIRDVTESSEGIIIGGLSQRGYGTYAVANPGKISITLIGGSGGSGSSASGGTGATVDAEFNVSAGDVIHYVIGAGSQSAASSAGGGGSSGLFINNELVMVAGGGGGGDNSNGAVGLGASSGEAGLTGSGTDPGTGGQNGQGGGAGSNDNNSSGGGGINSAGADANNGIAKGGAAADLDPSDGLTVAPGGAAGTQGTAGGSGFTGGGGSGQYYGAGGGGYSGGGASGARGSAGGGGSYLNSSSTRYIAGNITAGANGIEGVNQNGANGSITMRFISSDFDGDGIDNQFDLDSDGDGCPDAFEGGAGIPANNISPTGTLLGDINTDPNSANYGIPLLAGQGQDPGSSQNQNQQPQDCPVIQEGSTFQLRMVLEGPFDSNTGLMGDRLRTNGLIGLSDPYGLGASTTQDILNIEGSDAIVEWIEIILLDKNDPAIVVGHKAMLLQRNGDVVMPDGSSRISFESVAADAYYIVIGHLNHLKLSSAAPIDLSSNPFVDFSNSSTPVYGTAGKMIGSIRALISGDANGDGSINAVDKNSHWQVENGSAYQYGVTKADFNCDGFVNAVDKNLYWRGNNSMVEQLPE